ncbi:hypothetical protein [Kocuria arenosa]|uniref:hypothetical protein n=1 Tax=Kocuria arenosa TaxID=3071446 RepID=UPI0034D682EC
MNLQVSEWIDLAAVLVAGLAFVVAVVAAVYSRRSAVQAERSADVAEQQHLLVEEQLQSRHIRWELASRWASSKEVRYDLHNAGRDTAHKVRVMLPAGYNDLEVEPLVRKRDVPGGSSLTFFIRRDAGTVEPADSKDVFGEIPDYVVDSIVQARRRLRPEELPQKVLVSCTELRQEIELDLPLPPPSQG